MPWSGPVGYDPRREPSGNAGKPPARRHGADRPDIRRERAIDSWALALLRRVRGDELPIPAAVVFPASTEEVATVLAWASETSTAVIPRGGGSGVCGGAQAEAGSVVLDLSRMDTGRPASTWYPRR